MLTQPTYFVATIIFHSAHLLKYIAKHSHTTYTHLLTDIANLFVHDTTSHNLFASADTQPTCLVATIISTPTSYTYCADTANTFCCSHNCPHLFHTYYTFWLAQANIFCCYHNLLHITLPTHLYCLQSGISFRYYHNLTTGNTYCLLCLPVPTVLTQPTAYKFTINTATPLVVCLCRVCIKVQGVVLQDGCREESMRVGQHSIKCMIQEKHTSMMREAN